MLKRLSSSIFVILILFSTHFIYAQIVSDFISDDQGWTVSGNPTFTYSATGGNSGGFIKATDVAQEAPGPFYWYFNAPAKFLGDLSSYYNGNLSFDLQQGIDRTPVSKPDVLISDGINSLYYITLLPVYPAISPAWTSYNIVLSEHSGNWKVRVCSSACSFVPATKAEIQTVLSNAINLSIRGRYGDIPATFIAGGLDNISLQPFTVTTQPTPQSVCNGSIATLSTVAAGNNSIVYQWQFFNSAAGGYSNVSDIGGYSGTGTNTLAINTTGNFGAGSYRCLISGTDANDIISNTATVAINASPAAPSVTGAVSCLPGSAILNAADGVNGQYRWYTVSTGGTAITGEVNSTYATPSLTTTTTYYVSINNSSCESARTAVTATINTIPTAPTATGASSCSSASVILNASDGVNGQYRWYATSTGGTAIAGEVNSTYVTPLLTATTTYYVSINNGSCESARTVVTATINTIPTAPTATGASSCSPASIILNAGGGADGQYRWYTTSTGGTAISGEVNSTYVTPSLTTMTTYYVSINNGSCESVRTSVAAIINTIPTTPTATGASSCSPASIILNAAGGVNGQYHWYTVSTGGTAISGEVNNTYTTPSLTTTTTYYVSINNGSCESARMDVTATINTVPTIPTTTGTTSCLPGSAILNASGGLNGQYRWYTTSTGRTAISGEVNSAYTTPSLTTTTTYYVSINNGSCEGARTAVTAAISSTACNLPPLITPAPLTTRVGGEMDLNLSTLIFDPNDNLDLTTLTIIKQPDSRAVATIDANANLHINYQGVIFSGIDKLTIQVCDLAGACTQQVISIEVIGSVNAYNAVSPNGDGKNDFFYLQYIDAIASTKNNHLSIYNRWGDEVFSVNNYNNTSNVFSGISSDGKLLPAGTYFYKVTFTSGENSMTGYIELKY